jgi:hypothetical protein
MHRHLALTVLLLSSIALAQQPTTRPAEEEPEDVRVHTGSATEYSDMIEELGIEGEQLQRLQQAIDARAAALSKWSEGERGQRLISLREQLAAARREKRTAEIAPLREQIQPLSEEYWSLRNQTRLDILNVLTDQQKTQYLASILHRRVLTAIGDMPLTDAQKLRVRQLADDAARTELADHDWAKDPFVQSARPIAERIAGQIKQPATQPAQ